MLIPENAERVQRKIGGKNEKGVEFEFTVSAPKLFKEGETLTLTAGIASVLNQTLFENLGNNLRAKLGRGFEVTAPADGKEGTYRPFTPEEAQAEVDKYLAEYEFGVRSGGNGQPRITDPVEREALDLAGSRVDAFLAEKGIKRKDVDWKEMRQKLFDKNKEGFMKEAKRIVDQRNKALAGASDMTDDLVDFLPGVGGEPKPDGEGGEGGEGDES